jgi:hypothetical protein
MIAGLLRLEKRRELLLLLYEVTNLNKTSAYCKRLAFIFARGWPGITLNQSAGVMALVIFGVNRIFERGPENRKRDARILSGCKKFLPKNRREVPCLANIDA